MTNLPTKAGMLVLLPGFGNFMVLADIIDNEEEPYIKVYGSTVIASDNPLVPKESVFGGELYESVAHIIEHLPEELAGNNIAVIPCVALDGYVNGAAFIIENEEEIEQFTKSPNFDTVLEIQLK